MCMHPSFRYLCNKKSKITTPFYPRNLIYIPPYSLYPRIFNSYFLFFSLREIKLGKIIVILLYSLYSPFSTITVSSNSGILFGRKRKKSALLVSMWRTLCGRATLLKWKFHRASLGEEYAHTVNTHTSGWK